MQRVICQKELNSKLNYPVCWITNWSGWFCLEDETLHTSNVLFCKENRPIWNALFSNFQINPYLKLCLAETDWHWKASCHRFGQGVCFLYCEKSLIVIYGNVEKFYTCFGFKYSVNWKKGSSVYMTKPKRLTELMLGSGEHQ